MNALGVPVDYTEGIRGPLLQECWIRCRPRGDHCRDLPNLRDILGNICIFLVLFIIIIMLTTHFIILPPCCLMLSSLHQFCSVVCYCSRFSMFCSRALVALCRCIIHRCASRPQAVCQEQSDHNIAKLCASRQPLILLEQHCPRKITTGST